MADEEVENLKRLLLAARSAARIVPFEERKPEGWEPSRHACHANADRWALQNEDVKSVRGWLVFDFAKTSMGLINVVRFTAHSVNRAPNGALFDITPSQASKRYGFIPHPGTEEEFRELVEGRGIVHIECEPV